MAKIFMKSSWGSDNPTNAEMVFGHGNALANARLIQNRQRCRWRATLRAPVPESCLGMRARS